MDNQRIRVTISDSKLIPTIGKGPINRPISITVRQYEMLKKLGFNVIKYEDKVTKIDGNIKSEKPQEPVKQVQEPVEELDKIKESEQTQETGRDEGSSMEGSESEGAKDGEEDVVYTEEDLKEATKKELKDVLEARKIEYKYNDTIANLKTLVISSNPQA